MIMRRPSGFIEPCLPSKVVRPPSGPSWVHEIKHDGYRLMVRRDGARVRCFTRNGHDWADSFPAIVDAAIRIKAASFCQRHARITSSPRRTELAMRGWNCLIV
jgi:ATP-dependent DNA ligase